MWNARQRTNLGNYFFWRKAHGIKLNQNSDIEGRRREM